LDHWIGSSFFFDQVSQAVDQQVSIHANFDFSQDFEIEIFKYKSIRLRFQVFKIDWQLFES